jgi:hypothetical protein
LSFVHQIKRQNFFKKILQRRLCRLGGLQKLWGGGALPELCVSQINNCYFLVSLTQQTLGSSNIFCAFVCYRTS